MKRVCSYCKKVYGEKEPYEDKSETHGACDKCYEIELKKLEEIENPSKGDSHI